MRSLIFVFNLGEGPKLQHYTHYFFTADSRVIFLRGVNMEFFAIHHGLKIHSYKMNMQRVRVFLSKLVNIYNWEREKHDSHYMV